MLLKFPEQNATKFLLVLFIPFCYGIAFPQASQEKSLQRKSEEILSKEVSFQWPGGPLPELLKELSTKENLNFSYSREKIKHITVSNQDVKSESISSLLTRILLHSGYTYIVIGKTIAFVEDKNKPDKELINTKDSVISEGTEAPENTINNHAHIYPGSSVADRLPYHIRKKLRKIYRLELRLARKHTEDTTDQNKAPVTLEKTKEEENNYMNSGLFFSGNAGLSYFLVTHQSNFRDWKKQFDFKSRTHISVNAAVKVGYIYKKYILETGISFSKIKLENSYVKDDKAMKIHEFSEEYNVFTFPANIILFKKINNILLGAGPGVDLSFIERIAKRNKMKPYYDLIVGPDPEEEYSEKTRNIVPGINIKFFTEYKLNEKWSVLGNIFFNIPLISYHTNSVYRLYPNTVSVQLCFSYSFL